MINCIICSGRAPILWAADKNNIKLIQNLIAYGAEATDTDYVGGNMLHYTTRNTDTEIIKQFPYLINKGSCNGKYTIIIHISAFY